MDDAEDDEVDSGRWERGPSGSEPRLSLRHGD